MPGLVYTYALIKSLFDQGSDYIDAFWPFVLRVTPSDRFVDIAHIRLKLAGEFSFTIPIHVVNTLLARARKNGYLEQKRNTNHYKLNQAGVKYLEDLEAIEEVNRRINALVEDIRKFSEELATHIDSEAIKDSLYSFLRKNIEPLIEYFDASAKSDLEIQYENNEEILVDYIKVAQHHKPEHFNTLKELIFGSIISTVLFASDASVLGEIQSKKFKNCQVFLDTNFVFNMLGLTHKEATVPAIELFDLLKKHGFEVRIFSFTKDEICNVIKRYPSEVHCYPDNIRINALFSNLKNKGWTKTKALEFVANIDTILAKNGILVRNVNVNLNDYKLQDEGIRSMIAQYKPNQTLLTQNHDLAAIDEIRRMRKRSVNKVEDAQAIFLTSDTKLSKFNYDRAHKDNGSVCEVMLDRLLANILWLKDPSSEIPLHEIIASHSRNLFINKQVWRNFYEALKELKRNGQVNDDIILSLFYHNYVEEALGPLGEEQADTVTTDFVLAKIKEAERRRSERNLKRKEEVSRALDKRVTEVALAKDKEWLQLLDEQVIEVSRTKENEIVGGIDNRLRATSEQQSKIIVWSAIAIITLIALGYCANLAIKKDWPAFSNAGSIASLISVAGMVFIGVARKARESLIKMVADKIYAIKRTEIGLADERSSASDTSSA